MRKISTVIGLALFLSVAAHAADQTKINFDQPIKDVKGATFNNCDEADQKTNPPKCIKWGDLTLEKMALTALQMIEPGTSGTEQTRRAYLALRIYEVKTIGISSADIKLIQDLIAKANFNPVAVYRAYDLLDGSVPK